MPRTHQGLSLIELLIVVAVVGILAGIAYPSYRDTVKRAARSEVVGLLFDSAQHLERHRARTGQYADTDAVITPLPPRHRPLQPARQPRGRGFQPAGPASRWRADGRRRLWRLRARPAGCARQPRCQQRGGRGLLG